MNLLTKGKITVQKSVSPAIRKLLTVGSSNERVHSKRNLVAMDRGSSSIAVCYSVATPLDVKIARDSHVLYWCLLEALPPRCEAQTCHLPSSGLDLAIGAHDLDCRKIRCKITRARIGSPCHQLPWACPIADDGIPA